MFPWLPPTARRPRLASRPSIDSVRDLSLGQLVRDDILALILRGALAPGMRINEPDVAARLGISRVPVREALRSLESSGLVVARKHSGVFVREIDAAEVEDLYAFRALLDGGAGRRVAAQPAAQRRAVVRVLESATAAMRKAARRGDVDGYYAENLRFHWAIVEAAGSAKLTEAYIGVVQQLHLWRLKNLSQPAGMPASMKEHEDIVQSIRAGDAARAESRLSAHVVAAHDRLANHLAKEATT